MLKVLIADDEKNICIMIKKLVNWSAYDMQVIDMVHNGVDAMRVIEQQRPDVVISDIRMPGYDGLDVVKKTREMQIPVEFVIISGYKQFEYAHTALTHGVEHYLLKPIDKAELESTMEKIYGKLNADRVIPTRQERRDEWEQNNRRQIRQHFLTEILGQSSVMENSASVEQESEYGFPEDCFICVFCKIDVDEDVQDMSGLLNIVQKKIESDFERESVDYINSPVNSGIVTIFNYKPEEAEMVMPGVERSFRQICFELEKFRGVHFTVGVGKQKTEMKAIARSVEEAIYAIKCRGRIGLDRIIAYDQLHFCDVDAKGMVSELERELSYMVTSLDADAFAGQIDQSTFKIKQTPNSSPVSIYEFMESVTEVVLRTMSRNNVPEDKISDYRRRIQREMDYYANTDQMIYKTEQVFTAIMRELQEERQNRSQRPIRMASQYIQAHFAEPISQETVAEAIGLSTAYLSTLFKKEMGINFSDYLISCRMEEAKKLLKETQLSMAEIADRVGYQDAKYFSKTFHKVVGLKPTAYRKMYS